MSRVICWFSRGAASAVAAKLAVNKYGDRCNVVYMDTGSEHPDGDRFSRDIEKWLGKEITILKSEKYHDIWDVFEKTRFLVSPRGARCTTELKKVLRHAYQMPDDLHIFGYTLEEAVIKRPYTINGKTAKLTRCENFEMSNPELNVEWILADNDLTKDDCLGIIDRQGIEIPVMYKMGYRNNNCIGCVKGGKGYWNKIRVDFPDTFDRMSKLERDIGATVLKDCYLDELDPKAGHYPSEIMPSCGLTCSLVEAEINA